MRAYEFLNRPDRYTVPRAVQNDRELWAHINSLREQTRDVLCSAPRLLADEVWDAHPALREASASGTSADSLIRMAAEHAVRSRPPYENVWLEARVPAFDDDVIRDVGGGVPWVGVGVGTYEAANTPRRVVKSALRGCGLPVHSEFGFCVGGTVWVFWREGYTPVAMSHVVLDSEGCPVRGPRGDVAFSVVPFTPDGTPGDDAKRMWSLGVISLALAISTFGFLGCANVEVVRGGAIDDVTPRKDRRVSVADMTYKVLRVRRPDKRLVRLDGSDPSGSGSDRPLHSVRGHFKRYDGKDGRGLFLGKYERTVWCPPHVRGSRSAGVVVKDYEVSS